MPAARVQNQDGPFSRITEHDIMFMFMFMQLVMTYLRTEVHHNKYYTLIVSGRTGGRGLVTEGGPVHRYGNSQSL